MLVLADGDLLFSGSPARLQEEVAAASSQPPVDRRDFEADFVAFLNERGH